MATITAPRPNASSNHSESSLNSSQDGKLAFPSASGVMDNTASRRPSDTPQHGEASRPRSMSRKSSQPGSPQLNGDQVVDAVVPAPKEDMKRPGLSSRITRMFSHRDSSSNLGPNETVRNRDRSTSATLVSDDSVSESGGRSRNTSYSGNNPLKSQPNGSAAISEKLNTIGHTKDFKGDLTPSKRRFVLLEDGTHEHTLKPDKRQETLSDMFKGMFGKKSSDGIDESQHQLSLVSNWVDQVKNEKTASDEKGGPNCASTLVEKYGKCQEVVGRGAFGIVRISHKSDNKDPKKEQLYAVKEFRRRPTESPKKYNKRLTSEFCISSALRHPNVIHTLDLMKDAKGDFCEVMEYCAGGDLYTLVLAAVKLDVLEADCYFKQLMRGVEYIHEMGVAHRDLKPENILLTSRGALKITDFGNGECFRMAWEKEPHMVAGLCGSAPYIAPEEYTDTEFDPRAVDVWACGVIFMAMRTGRHLWRVAKRDEDDFYDRYCEGRKGEEGYGPIESLHRARCRNVIYSVLDPNPRRRITASQVLKSEWGVGIKLCRAGEEGL